MSNPKPKSEEEDVRAHVYAVTKSIKLERPQKAPNVEFFEVLGNRRSGGLLTNLSVDLLGAVLWYAAKANAVHLQPNGYVLSKRPSPSAGARHPLDIWVFNPGTLPTLAYYNPFEHTLNYLAVDQAALQHFEAHLNENRSLGDATIFWMVAHRSRTAAKYEYPDSLIWRDAGALLATVQLVCTAFKIGSLPLGTLAHPYFDQLSNNKDLLSCGGIIIGNYLEL